MTNYKPFNLERALAGDEVVTRKGRKVLKLCFFENVLEWPVVAHIESQETVLIFDKDGKYSRNDISIHDLFMLQKKKKLWIPIARESSSDRYHTTEHAYTSKELAEQQFDTDTWQIVEVEIDCE